MASAKDGIDYGVAAAGSLAEPASLLQRHQAMGSPGPVTTRVGVRTVDGVRI